MSRRKTPSPVKRRNPLHDAPMLRKCDVHGKTRKAQRRGDKVALRNEWRSPWRWILAPIENAIRTGGLRLVSSPGSQTG